MEGYLGEVLVMNLTGTPFENYDEKAWAREYIQRYGWVDGSHHKTWVLDQVMRILFGTPVLVSLARWSNGRHEYRFKTGSPSPAYLRWKEEREEDGSHDEGIAP